MSINYRPEIDGLRAVAVVPVILFHLGFQWIPGGYAGVDVFFVISGYLITSIILKEVGASQFSLRDFWLRRIRRVLPALVVVTLSVLLFATLFGYKVDNPALGLQALASLFSVANIYMWRSQGDYWGGEAEHSPFLHCWSLSVEEQFYIFYPVALAFLLARKRSFAMPAVAVAMQLSLALFIYGSFKFPVATFYLLPPRGWELAAGGLVAFAWYSNVLEIPSGVKTFLANLGFSLVVVSYVVLPESVSPLMIAPVLGAAAFIAFAPGTSGAGGILSMAPVVYIGKISYSLYLWHWPVIVLSKMLWPGKTDSALGIGLMSSLTLLLSIASYHLVEQPRRRKGASLVPIGVGFAGSLVLAALAINQRDITPYDTSAYENVVFRAPHYDVVPKPPAETDVLRKKMAEVEVVKRSPEDQGAFRTRGILKQYGGEQPDIAVFGDSHATMWSGVIDDISKELGLTTSFFGAVGTHPYFDDGSKERSRQDDGFTASESKEFDAARKRVLREAKPLVVLSIRWSTRVDEPGLKEIIEYAASAGCRVLLIEQPPELLIGDRNSAQYISFLGLNPSGESRLEVSEANSETVIGENHRLRQIAESYSNCTVVPTYDLFDGGDKEVFALDGRQILYYDDDHLSEAGARVAKDRLREAIRENLASE